MKHLNVLWVFLNVLFTHLLNSRAPGSLKVVSMGGSVSSKKKFFLICDHAGQRAESQFPKPGIEPLSPAVKARSLNHWITREVPHVIAVPYISSPPGLSGGQGIRPVIAVRRGQAQFLIQNTPHQPCILGFFCVMFFFFFQPVSSCLLLTSVKLLVFWFLETVDQTTQATIASVKVTGHKNQHPHSSEGHSLGRWLILPFSSTLWYLGTASLTFFPSFFSEWCKILSQHHSEVSTQDEEWPPLNVEVSPSSSCLPAKRSL